MRKLFDLIGELKRDGVAIVYVSHRLHEVDELADRISVMRDGEIIDSRPAATITPAEIVAMTAGRPLGQIFSAQGGLGGRAIVPVRFERPGLRSGRRRRACRRNRRSAGIEARASAIHARRGRRRPHSGGAIDIKDAKVSGDSPAPSAGPASASYRTTATAKVCSSSDAPRELQPWLSRFDFALRGGRSHREVSAPGTSPPICTYVRL